MPAIPDRIGKSAVIQLTIVDLVAPAEEIIGLEQEPDWRMMSTLRDEFDRFEPSLRYRGKFALKFFFKWFEVLAEEYSQGRSNIFDGVEKSH